MIKVYVAGKLNDSACGYIKNIHRMIKEAYKLRRLGYSVYVPCVDILEGIVSGDFEYLDYFDNSQPWLLSSDAIYCCPGWESSKGTLREIETAKANNIPVFYNIETLNQWFAGVK
jgi:hypothetical protein